MKRDGDHLTVRFMPPLRLAPAPPATDGMPAITASGTLLDMTVPHGAAVQPIRIGGKVAFDVFTPVVRRDTDAPENAAGDAPNADGAPSNAPPATVAASSAAAEAATASPREPAGPPASQPLMTPVSAPLGRDVLPAVDNPMTLAAHRIRLPRGVDGSAIVVPFGPGTGAAAFRAAGTQFVVFDERRPVDMAPLRDDPVFKSATVQMLPNGTLFRVPLPPNLQLDLALVPQGWRIGALAVSPKPRQITASVAEGRMRFGAEEPSKVVSLADPDTGATLLAGTVRHPGQAVALPRASSEFLLRPTLQGVLVEPIADYLTMTVENTGFILGREAGSLHLSATTANTNALIDAAHLTRRFRFLATPPEDLVPRIAAQFTSTGKEAPMARGAKRHATAENLLALGFAAEAQALFLLAAEDDPKEAASADTTGLTAIAALLAGRVNEADGLDDPRLNGTDEIAFWRAVRQAMRDEGSPAAAAIFATTAPLIATYPPPIANRVQPLVIETLLLGGEVAPAARFLERHPNNPRLAYARALRQEAEGNTDKALAMLDELAAGRDQFDRTRAAVHAIELRLRNRRIDQAQAADALDKLLYAWRGDDHELALRLRIADLRAATGAWRTALQTVRDAEDDFPEKAHALHIRMMDMFASMVRSDAQAALPPLEFVTIVDENADLLPKTDDELPVDQPLAERLLALDLPGRAEPLLQKLLKNATAPAAKARLGLSLATLQSREHNDSGALAALDASESPDLPPDLVEQRGLLRARLMAHNGDRPGAAALLAQVATPHAAIARAEMDEKAQDWEAAERDWLDVADLTFPASGPLDEDRTRTLVRLASAMAHAKHDTALVELRRTYGDRLAAGSLGDMFRLLTAEPIRGLKDLQRSKQEVGMAASLPAGLKAMEGDAATR